MPEFKLAVATALSATGFLLGFFRFPSSRTILWCSKSWSLTRDLNPGAGSVQMTAGGLSKGRS